MLVKLFWATVVLWIILIGIAVASVPILFYKLEKIKKVKVSPLIQGFIVALILWGGQNILNTILSSF